MKKNILTLFLLCLFYAEAQNKHQNDFNQILEVPIAFHYASYENVLMSKQAFRLFAEKYLDYINNNFKRTDHDGVYKDFIPYLAPDIQIRFVLANVSDQFSMHGNIKSKKDNPIFHYSGNAIAGDIDYLNSITVSDGRYIDIWFAPITKSGKYGFTTDAGKTIVVINDFLGVNTAEANFFYGYTLTHEIGHFLNLNHLNGPFKNNILNSSCLTDDGIEDTPKQAKLNDIGVDEHKAEASCDSKISNKTNWQNFMDYTYSRGMFTKGQRLVMRSFLLDNLSFVSKQSPSNDDCFGAELLTPQALDSDLGARTKGSIFRATTEELPSNPTSCDTSSGSSSKGAGVWYKFNAKQSSYSVELLHDNTLNPVISIYSGSDCDSLVYKTCAKNDSDITNTSISLTDLIKGETYWIRVHHVGNNTLSLEESMFTIGVIIERPEEPFEVHDDTYIMTENTTLTFNPYENDNFPENSTYVFHWPMNGFIAINENNTPSLEDDKWTYHVNSYFTGIDSLNYEVCNSDGECKSAIIIINVESAEVIPEALDDIGTVSVGSSTTINILVNDYYFINNPNSLDTTLTDLGTGTAIGAVDLNATTGELIYTPVSKESGDVTVNYQVCSDIEPIGLGPEDICARAIVTITVRETDNDEPDAPGDGFKIFSQKNKKDIFLLDEDYTVGTNPLLQNSQFYLNIQKSENLDIRLVDIQGRTIRTVFKGKKGKGSHSFSILGENDIPNGMYVLRVSRNGIISTIKLVK